jgi:hypothetical protein
MTSRAGTLYGKVPIPFPAKESPQGADVVKFDAGLRRAYAACSSGFISIIQEGDPEYFRKLEDFPIKPLVHSLALDSPTHRLYGLEQEEDGHPVARIVIYEPTADDPISLSMSDPS